MATTLVFVYFMGFSNIGFWILDKLSLTKISASFLCHMLTANLNLIQYLRNFKCSTPTKILIISQKVTNNNNSDLLLIPTS